MNPTTKLVVNENETSITPCNVNMKDKNNTRPLRPFNLPNLSPKKPPKVLANMFINANDKTTRVYMSRAKKQVESNLHKMRD